MSMRLKRWKGYPFGGIGPSRINNDCGQVQSVSESAESGGPLLRVRHLIGQVVSLLNEMKSLHAGILALDSSCL